MYDEQDFGNISKQLKRILILLFSILAFFIVISIVIAKLVNNRLGMVVMLLGVCVDVFILGMYVTPIFSYYGFIKDLATGRSRKIEGLVKGISEKPVYKDNKLFYYELKIVEDGVERVLLLDDQKEWPNINVDRRYGFQIHENFVINLWEIA